MKTELSPTTVTSLVVEESDEADHEDSDEDMFADRDEGDGDDNDHLSPLAAHQHRSSQLIPGEEAEDLKKANDKRFQRIF